RDFHVTGVQTCALPICGHYGCGGIKAAMDPHEHGLIDNWLRHVRDVSRFNAKELQKLSEAERIDRLCELNVVEQVSNISNSTIRSEERRVGKERRCW